MPRIPAGRLLMAAALLVVPVSAPAALACTDDHGGRGHAAKMLAPKDPALPDYRPATVNRTTRTSLLAARTTTLLAAADTTSEPFAWTSAADYPTPRFESDGLAAEGRLWVIGGFGTYTTEATPRSDSYDPVTDTWTRIQDIPINVTHAPAVYDGDGIWILGGYEGNYPGVATDQTWRYDIDDDTWERGPDLPARRGAGGAAITGRRIHFFGGGTSQQPSTEPGVTETDDHWVLDLDDLEAGWETAADLPTARNHLAGVEFGGLLYAIGGQIGTSEDTGNTARVERYDPGTDTWERVADMPTPRGHITASVFAADGRIFVTAGTKAGRVPAPDIETFDPATGEWTVLPPLPAGRKTPVIGEIDGRIVASTGWNGVGTTATWVSNRLPVPADTEPVDPPDTADGPWLPQAGTVVMEAEDAETVDRGGRAWTPTTTPSGALGESMVVANAGTTWGNTSTAATQAPEMRFPVRFPGAGTWKVYLRSNMPDEAGNSVHVGLDGVIPATSDNLNKSTFNSWLWLKYSAGGPDPATVTVPSAGVHTVSVWPREDGARIDRVLLTTGSAPSGEGPAESPRETTGPDTTGPSLTGRTPAAGATGVAVDADVTATFSEPLAAASVDDESIVLTDPEDTEIAATRSVNGSTVTISPSADLASGTTYTVTVTDQVTDAAGNALEDAPESWTFTTATSGGGGTGTGPWLPQSGTVVMEAENGTVVARGGRTWAPVTTPTGSVGASMAVANAGTTWGNTSTAVTQAPELRFPVTFPAAGTWKVYLRSNMPDEAGNSVHVGLDGVIPATSDNLNKSTFNSWLWLKYSAGGPDPATVSVPGAGVHTVSLWPREDGARVDRIVLTTGSAPTGNGPAESPRG